MRWLLAIFVLLFGHQGALGAAPAEFVRVVGTTFAKDAAGTELKLRGFNLGGWLAYEHDFFRAEGQPFDLTGARTEPELRKYIDSTQGAGRGTQYFDGIRDNFVSKEDIAEMKALGAEVVRVPIAYWLFPPMEQYPAKQVGNQSVPIGYYYLDQLLDWAEELELYVIVSLRIAPGCQNRGEYCSSEKKANLNLEKTRSLWNQLAARYFNRTVIAGYDLLSSPEASDSDVESWYVDLLTAIRVVDNNHVVWMMGNKESEDPLLHPTASLFESRWAVGLPNVAFSFAMFKDTDCPLFNDYQGVSRTMIENNYVEFVQDQGHPIGLTEFGGDCEEWQKAIFQLIQTDYEDLFFPVTYWSFKAMQLGNMKPRFAMFRPTQSAMDDWVNLHEKLTQEKKVSDGEWEAGLSSLAHSNFELHTEFSDIFEMFIKGEKIEYMWLGWLWILLICLGGLLIAVAAGFGLYKLKKKRDAERGFF